MGRTWIAVASADHVREGRRLGIMQVCHGKAAPLRRTAPGDRVIYYSPTVTLGGGDRMQAFTAIGAIRDAQPYQVDIGEGFRPWRRDVAWWVSREASIRPLLAQLDFTRGSANWGHQMRFGLFTISEEDGARIAAAMLPEGPDRARISQPQERK